MSKVKCWNCKSKFDILDNQIFLHSKKKCPFCYTVFCDKTKTEGLLFTLQDKWKETKNLYYLNEMAKVMIPYAQSLLKRHFRNRIQLGEGVEYVAEQSVAVTIDPYLTNPDYSIDDSFGGLLKNFKFKQVWNNKNEKLLEDISLQWMEETYEKNTELPSYDPPSIESEVSIQIIQILKFCMENYISSFLVSQSTPNTFSKKEDLAKVVCLYQFLENGEKGLESSLDIFGRQNIEHFKLAYNILRIATEHVIFNYEKITAEIKL